MHNLGKAHWEAVKWILRYLKGSPDLGLVFNQHRADPEEQLAMLMLTMVVI